MYLHARCQLRESRTGNIWCPSLMTSGRDGAGTHSLNHEAKIIQCLLSAFQTYLLNGTVSALRAETPAPTAHLRMPSSWKALGTGVGLIITHSFSLFLYN